MRDRSDMMPLVVSEIIRETPSIVSIRLTHPSGEVLPAWEPGAHVDVQLVTRQERIAVHREPRSRGGSHYIHDHLRVGRRVYVRPPRNLFPLGNAPRYLLIAAGIGITPILAMARHLDATGADWAMISLARRPEDVAFAAELAGFGDRIRIHLSSVDGRLDLREVLASAAPGTAVYACGPQADGSMLRALRGAGVDAPGSCLRGVCGSCALTVLDGTPEHRDSLTVDNASPVIYPCVSRALSPTLTVDV
ncbi:MAG: oxidoreductase [Microbacterium sp.]|nr:oxidoreductase [Microbacterium sp.]